MIHQTTILIPLHQSLGFLDVVERNVGRLHKENRIVISDPFHSDDSIDLLQKRWNGQSDIEFIGERALAEGWIAHYNDLLSRVETPYFMWLAHDDEIDASYIKKCHQLFEENAGISAAVGQIESVVGAGFQSMPQPLLPNEDELHHYSSSANGLLATWNLGVLFRAVFRTDKVQAIPESFRGDSWADIVWAYGFCLHNSIAQDPTAIYWKRFYHESTHARWDHRLFWTAVTPYLYEEILKARKVHEEIVTVTKELLSIVSKFSTEQAEHFDRVQKANITLSEVGEELRKANLTLSAQLNDLTMSKSWRWTKPFRAISANFAGNQRRI